MASPAVSTPPAPPPSRPRRTRVALAAGLALLGGTACPLTGPLLEFLARFSWLAGSPEPVVAVLLAVLTALFAWAAWRPAAEWAGPLFFYDLVRLARRGRSTLLRTCYAVSLLAVLFLVYAHHFPRLLLASNPFADGLELPLHERARLASGFAAAVLALQGMAVLLCAPAYLAGAIAEERERRTLELLFTTHLTDREIVLGKLLSRMTHLAGILLAGLPVLSLLQLWGGVDAAALLAGFVVTAMTLFSVGGACLLCSVLSRDSLTTVLASYTAVLGAAAGSVLLPGCFIASPLSFMLVVEDLLGADALHQLVPWPTLSGATEFSDPAILFMAVVYALVHGTAGACCLAAAKAHLRWLPPPLPASLRTETVGGWGPEEWPAPLPDEPPPRPRCRVTDPPLLWKEVYHGAGPAARWTFRTVYPPAVAALLGLLLLLVLLGLPWVPVTTGRLLSSWAAAYQIVRDVANPALRVLVILLAAAWGLGVAWRAAGSVSRERERGTLVGLLMLPGDRGGVLNAKWLGGPLRYRCLGYGLLAALTVGLVSGAFHPLAVLLLALAVVVQLAFLASLGVWLSLVSRNTLWAYLGMALMLLLVFCGSWAVAAYGDLLGAGSGEPGGWEGLLETALNPPRALWALGFTWDDFATGVWPAGGELRPAFRAALYGLAAYGVAAALLWLAACRRFRHAELGEVRR